MKGFSVAKKKTEHYINNLDFFNAMKEWKILVDAADLKGEKHPPITEYIGICFMKIAENLARKPNFMNYQYKDEMQSDGVENCLLYAYNFDPTKSSNPFSYFTQIIYYAFLRRIQKEKKQAYIKYKKLEMSDDIDAASRKWLRENYFGAGGDKNLLSTSLTETDINNFEKTSSGEEGKKSRKTKALPKKKTINRKGRKS
jgi:hypothetical protein